MPGRGPTRFATRLAQLVVLSVLPFVVLAAGLAVSTTFDERKRAVAEMVATAESLRIAVERELRLAEAVLQSLDASAALDEALAAGSGGPAEALAAFHRQATAVVGHHRAAIHNILLLDTEGRQIVNTMAWPGADLPPSGAVMLPEGRPADAAGLEPAEVIVHVVATGEVYVTDLVVGPVAQRHITAVKWPVMRDGEVVGVLGANLLPSGFGEILRAHMPQSGYVAAVVDRAGIIVARTQDEERFIGRPATGDVQAFVEDPSLRAAQRPSLTADGREVHGAFRRLDAVPWTIAYGAPRAVLDEPLRRLVLVLGVAGTLALGFFVAATLSLGRDLAGQMGTLARDAEALGQGEGLPDRVDRIHEVAEVRNALRAGVASLAAAEERMRLAVEGSGMATWDVDMIRGEVAWAGHFLEMLGLQSDHHGPVPLDAWFDRVHPDDRQALDAQWEASSLENMRFHLVYRIRRAEDGAVRWLESYGAQCRNGGQHRFIGVTFDVTERHRADEQRQILMREVDHRAKNALAVVHSVVRLTRASDPASYAAAVEGRVRALARAHDLLARDRWTGANLCEMAAQELAAQVANGQVTIDGQPLLLVPQAIQPVSMVLHELATNAAKYGALSVPDGTVRLWWRLEEGDGPLRLEWTERGGPPAAPPTATGFGTRLIEVTVNGQLDGEVRFDWAPEGVRCAMTLPRKIVRGIAGAALPALDARGAAEEGVADLRGRRVLVVEDEAVIGAEIALSLSHAGSRPVGPFATVKAAEAALGEEERPVDAAILDVNLGRSDSFTLAQGLMAAGVPVVVVTGYSVLPSAWTDQNGLSAGLSAVLRKPVDPDELVAAIGRALRRKEAA